MTRNELLAAYAAGKRDFRSADLRDANLRGAYLGGAGLRGADLRDGPARSDGWFFFLQRLTGDEAPMVQAGCRRFTREQARKHWARTRGGTPLGDETTAILDERLRARGRL